MKLQALFVIAAAATFVAANPSPISPAFATSEDALIEDVGASVLAAPAPIVHAPHMTVAAALKKPAKPAKHRRTAKKPLTREQKRKRQAKKRAHRARLAAAGKYASGRVTMGDRPIRTRSTMGAKLPRVHGKPSGMARKHRKVRNPNAARKPIVPLATRLQSKINSLPDGSPLRTKYERRLAWLTKPKKPKTTALMSTAVGPLMTHLYRGDLTPFSEPDSGGVVSYEKDGSVSFKRYEVALGRGIKHKFGFQTRSPLAMPAGAQAVKIRAQVATKAVKPSTDVANRAVLACKRGNTALSIFHGTKRLFTMPFPKEYYGGDPLKDLEVIVPVADLSPKPAPVMVLDEHDHMSSPSEVCEDISTLTVRNLEFQPLDSMPAPPPGAKTTGTKRPGAKFAVADSGYHYESFDDDYDEGFSVSEDAYDGDDAWDDAYNGESYSIANEAGTVDNDDDEPEDAYYGGDFSLSEDAAYDGDDMWEDSYDGEGYSVEDEAGSADDDDED
ncbi:hypothetical protein GGF31_005679 [Allomyces arbusculus]|nr:hypothetical protein GGF31_005679 [Allomyces arbusculus]